MPTGISRASFGISIAPARELRGVIRVPGDKSITHRAFFLAAINSGSTTIANASPADDCARSREIVRSIGCIISINGSSIGIHRAMAGAFDREPVVDRGLVVDQELVVDCGNSGTTTRLAMGLLAAEQGRFVLVGDRSLSRRPMERVASPLRRLGAQIETTNGALPVRIEGGVLDGAESHGVITVESAQVHASVVIAALRSRSGASIFAARPMRDHTLRMLPLFGVRPSPSDSGVVRILPAEINCDVIVDVPGDFSSAAFMIVAAVLVPDSDLTIEDVGLNPTRIAFVRALTRMGAHITSFANDDPEPRGRVRARYSPSLTAAVFGGDDDGDVSVTEMIDELPLLALVATRAAGTTRFRDADELRVKESDRIRSTANVLRALGAIVTEHVDGLEITGPQSLVCTHNIDPAGDHRLAMMAAIGAMISRDGAVIDNAHVADVSYPAYWHDLATIGATVKRI